MEINREKFEILLAQKGLTQTKLAEKMGFCPQNISTLKMRGTCNPSTLIKLAAALEVEPAELMVKQ